MTSSYPGHSVLKMLMKKEQFDACRLTAEEMISDLMNPTDLEPDAMESQTEAVTLLRGRDRELACLHLILCKALFCLNQFRSAAEKADIATFLARKVQDEELVTEALFRAGVCYCSNGEYSVALQRLTESVSTGAQCFKADAFYNRGFVHQTLSSYPSAIEDYEAALALTSDHELARDCRINLAWVLILSREFPRAEQVLEELTSNPGSGLDERLQLQVAHDRLHMSYLKGEERDVLRRAYLCMQQAGLGYPHVRAYVVLTLMGLAADHKLPDQAFSLGILAKRLAGQAYRLDLDEEASRKMRELEYREGSDRLISALQRSRQVLRGAVIRRRTTSGVNQAGGVG